MSLVLVYSSTVNGNGTAHAGYHTEEAAAPAAAPTVVKETKVKAGFSYFKVFVLLSVLSTGISSEFLIDFDIVFMFGLQGGHRERRRPHE